MHYLLECNRHTNLDIIDNNILDKDVLYHLGNLSIEDAKIVIKSLTERSQFKLDSELIEQLVNDLAKDLGEVRPIELQVVGAQLQEEKITTLKQYLNLRSDSKKVELVERYLAKAIEDCGSPENTKLARLVLYLLTNEDGTCPLKTRAELIADLKLVGLKLEDNKLELVLAILVGSGMVLLVPESPFARYQLVHNYLVKFIRQERNRKLLDEFKSEKERRKSEEERRKRVQKRFNKFLLSASFISCVGLLVFAALALKAEIGEIKALAASSKVLFASHQQFDALIESLRARKRLRFGQESLEKAGVVDAMRQAVYGVKERNRLEGHEDWVNSVSFSPDGQTLATVSGKTLKLWQPDGKEIRSFREHTKRVTSVDFSPNGQIIATASEDNTVKLWQLDGKKSKKIDTLKHDCSVNSASFSRNGETIATACNNGIVTLWQWDGKKFQKRASWKGHVGEVYSVSFSPISSPDGQTLATASEDKTVKIWRWNGKKIENIDTLEGHTDRVHDVSFSPDGKTIASASWDYTVKLWNWDGKKSKEIDTLKGHSDRVHSVSFSPDNTMIATASADKTIKLWSADDTWKEVNTHSTILKGHEGRIPGLNCSLDDRATTTASKEVDAQPMTLTGHKGPIYDVTFSPDGKTIATASEDKTARIWRRDNGFLSTLFGHREEVYSISFSPDKQPDKQIVATASMDKTVKLWSREGTLLTTLKGHKNRVWGVSFSPVDRQILATASWDNTVRLWKWDGKEVQELGCLEIKEPEKGGQFFSVDFSPDGKRIVAVGSDKKVRIWSRDDRHWDLGGKVISTLWQSRHTENIVDVSFSFDGKLIATASDDRTVKLWKQDGTSFKGSGTLTGHTNEVNGVSFSQDGKLIATASDDRTVKLWKQDGTFITTLGQPEEDQHEDRVISVDFSPDSQMIASASFDKTVKLWDANNHKLLKTLSNHDNWVWDVSFSPDGKLLASTSSDKSAQLWHLNSTKPELPELETLKQDGCNWVRDYLKNNPRVEQSDRELCD